MARRLRCGQSGQKTSRLWSSFTKRSPTIAFICGTFSSTRTAHQRLSRVCFLDYDREFALLAEVRDPHSDDRRIVAVATLVKSPQKSEGEVAVLISDDCQRQGLGKELVRRLIGFARDEGLSRVVASTMFDNLGMSVVFERLGFQLSTDFEEQLVNATLSLVS